MSGTARLLEMRRLREAGWSLAAIGQRHGVSASRVSQLLGPDGRYAARTFRVSAPQPLTQDQPAA